MILFQNILVVIAFEVATLRVCVLDSLEFHKEIDLRPAVGSFVSHFYDRAESKWRGIGGVKVGFCDRSPLWRLLLPNIDNLCFESIKKELDLRYCDLGRKIDKEMVRVVRERGM